MERKIIKFEVKAIDEESGIIEGYGSTFGGEPDSYGDIVDPGAFTKTLKENADTIVSLFNHNTDQPIGLPELKEDKKGLFTRIKLVRGIQKAEETLLLAKAGVIKRLSIGYDAIKPEMIKGIRHLKEIRLYDVSPVIFAANTNAIITDVKSMSIEEMKSTIEHIQALLDKWEGKQEPEQTTPDPEANQEAADMDITLDTIQSELEGFDVEAANERIEAAIAKLN